jgi:hypothetical protein
MRLTASDFYTYLRPSKCDLRIYLKYRGEEEGAEEYYGQSLTILWGLADLDPKSVEGRRNLVVSHSKLSLIYSEQGKEAEALKHLESCRLTLRHMRDSGMFVDAPLEQLLGQLEKLFPGT